MTVNDATVSGPPATAGGQGAARQAGARLWRLAAVLAVLTCGLLGLRRRRPGRLRRDAPGQRPPSRGRPGDCHRSAAGQAG
jgi:hypothetical protein